MLNIWGNLTLLGYGLTFLLIPRVLLIKKQHSVSTVAWILAIVLLPYLGGLLFLFFGINRVQRRATHKQQSTRRISRALPTLSQYQLIPGEGLNPQQQRLMRMAQHVAGTVPTFGNQVELLADTNRTLGLIEQAILSATETVHLEYYIWQPDRTGTRLRDLLIVKAEDWFYATGEELTWANVIPRPAELGEVSAQVAAGGPDFEINVFHSLMFAAINEARGRITLATSYFVPTPSLVTALETAACRGLKVRLLVSGRSSNLWTLLAGRSYYDTLLTCGVEIYEYQRGLHHSKTLTIDGNWSLVGSPNFDARSLLLNFEIAVAIYDAKIAAQLEDHFESDLKHARKIELAEWSQRSTYQVVCEKLCRLFDPIL